jgi:hypothetical protein
MAWKHQGGSYISDPVSATEKAKLQIHIDTTITPGIVAYSYNDVEFWRSEIATWYNGYLAKQYINIFVQANKINTVALGTTTFQEVYVAPVTYNLTIPTIIGGTTNPTGTSPYTEGTNVTVTAVPSNGYSFSHWEANGTNIGANNPITITMNADYTLIAVFTSNPIPTTYNLTIPTATGGTTNPTGIVTYNENTNVIVTAIASNGYSFSNWELDGNNIGTINPATIIMNANHTLRAIFTLIPIPTVKHVLTINSTPIQGIPITLNKVA